MVNSDLKKRIAAIEQWGRARRDRSAGDFALAVLVLFVWLVAIGLAALWLCSPAKGAEPDRDRNARAALALAATAEKAPAARPAIAAAPMPHPKCDAPAPTGAPLDWMIRAETPKAGCDCGPDCPCKDRCPACSTKEARRELDRIRDAVVRVRVPAGQGSGTVIWSAEGKSVVLTAAHVVAGGGQVQVRAEGKWHAGTTIARDDAQDLAAVLVAAELPAVKVSEADPDTGAPVIMVGVTTLWSRGAIGTGYRLGTADVYELTYDSDSGDSGAGVFCRGELVGVHCGKCGAPGQSGKPYCAAAGPVRGFLGKCFTTRSGKVVVIEPPKPKATHPPVYEQPVYPSCPGGTCPAVAPPRRGLFR